MSGPGPKTLLPEMLPAPTTEAAATPRQRVEAVARGLRERFRGLGTVAGAAVLSVHCGYGVVDPLPPPPQQCSTLPDPLSTITAFARFAPSDGGTQPPVQLLVLRYHTLGFEARAVRVTGGMLVSVGGPVGGDPPGQITITLAPDSATAEMIVEIDIACGTATATKRYRLNLNYPTPGNINVVQESTV